MIRPGLEQGGVETGVGPRGSWRGQAGEEAGGVVEEWVWLGRLAGI